MVDFYSVRTPFRAELLLGPEWEFLIQTPPQSVLDVGSGYGSIPLYMAWLWPSTTVLATDVSADYFPVSESVARELGIPNITFAVSGISELQGGGQHSVVTCCNVLNFMRTREDLVSAVAGLARLTLPGGTLAIYTPHFGIREPFSRVPFLHWFPRFVQEFGIRLSGKRQSLKDTRNPWVREVLATARAENLELVHLRPARFLRRMLSTHVTMVFRKSAG